MTDLATASLRWRLLAPVAIIGLLLSGCDWIPGREPGIGAGIVVDNRTDEDLHFQVFLNGTWFSPPQHAASHATATIVPVSMLDENRCTDGGLIAFADDDREVGRHDAPLCVGEVWTINAPSIDGSSPGPTSSRSNKIGGA